MRQYVVSRLLQGLVVIVGASLITFILAALSGSPADLQSTSGFLTKAQIEELSEQLGYGDPLPVRYTHFLIQAVQGDFGESYRYHDAALATVVGALPATLALVGGALLLSTALALALAVWSVLRRERVDDRAMRRTLMVLQGVPEFWLALILVTVFSVSFGWFPVIGFEGPSSLVLPVLALSAPMVPTFVRLIRLQLLDIMRMEYITAARAKGLSEFDVILRHGVRNALPALITFMALQIGWLIGGTLLVEYVFAWPGLGTTMLQAVNARDITIIQATVMVVAVTFVGLNLAADLIVLRLDPRIRLHAS
jgi:peptide/nickel transport system permease protein